MVKFNTSIIEDLSAACNVCLPYLSVSVWVAKRLYRLVLHLLSGGITVFDAHVDVNLIKSILVL